MSNFPAPFPRLRDFSLLFYILGVIALMALVLAWQGRLWICSCGYVRFWVGDINSSDNSQHIFDPYTSSHILHGVCFFGMLWGLRHRLSGGTRFIIAAVIEAGWEILENSPIIINRYREGTIALGYTGDTILNSVSDLLSCLFGFWLAFRLGGWKSLIFFLLVEIVMVLSIRDSLILNVIMLIYPSETIRAWQAG